MPPPTHPRYFITIHSKFGLDFVTHDGSTISIPTISPTRLLLFTDAESAGESAAKCRRAFGKTARVAVHRIEIEEPAS